MHKKQKKKMLIMNTCKNNFISIKTCHYGNQVVKKYYFNLAIWKIGILGVGRYILGWHMRGKRSSIGAYGYG